MSPTRKTNTFDYQFGDGFSHTNRVVSFKCDFTGVIGKNLIDNQHRRAVWFVLNFIFFRWNNLFVLSKPFPFRFGLSDNPDFQCGDRSFCCLHSLRQFLDNFRCTHGLFVQRNSLGANDWKLISIFLETRDSGTHFV